MAAEAPANTLGELNNQIHACLKIPSTPEGGDMTLLFSIKRDGSLLGKPRIVFIKNQIIPRYLAQFINAISEAMKGCFPLKITEGLGSILAGKPIRYRITQSPDDKSI